MAGRSGDASAAAVVDVDCCAGTVARLAVSVVDVERRQGELQRVSELGECLRQSVRQLGDRPMRTAQLDATDHRIKTVLKIVGRLV